MFQNCLCSFSDILNQKRDFPGKEKKNFKKRKERVLKMVKYKMTNFQGSFQLPHLAAGVWEH